MTYNNMNNLDIRPTIFTVILLFFGVLYSCTESHKMANSNDLSADSLLLDSIIMELVDVFYENDSIGFSARIYKFVDSSSCSEMKKDMRWFASIKDSNMAIGIYYNKSKMPFGNFTIILYDILNDQLFAALSRPDTVLYFGEISDIPYKLIKEVNSLNNNQ